MRTVARLVAAAPLPAPLRRPLRWVYRRARPRQPVDVLHDELRSAVASGDRRRIDAALLDYRRLGDAVEEAVAPSVRASPDIPIRRSTLPQSTQFMIDLLPHLQRYLASTPRGRALDVLDVGPGNGHGTGLLASLYATSRLGYTMRVTAVDVVEHYFDYIRVTSPLVNTMRADVFTMDQRFDLVLASHVIEHVPDPVRFCRRLQQLARECVFVVAPYNEPRDRLTKGHRNVIDAALVEQLDADDVHVMKSVAWGAFCDPPYEMLIARLPGRA